MSPPLCVYFNPGAGMKNYKDYTNRTLKAFDAEMKVRMTKAGITVANEIKRNISTKGGNGNHSSPWQFPYLISGILRSSVTYQVAKTATGWVCRVGSPILYSKFLELGTYKMDPRPLFRRGVQICQGHIKRIFRGK